MTEKDTASIALDLHCKGVTYSGKSTITLSPASNRRSAYCYSGSKCAGKTTLLKVILDHLNTSSQKAALIPQELGLVENLSVYHNVYIGRLDQYSTFLINLTL